MFRALGLEGLGFKVLGGGWRQYRASGCSIGLGGGGAGYLLTPEI